MSTPHVGHGCYITIGGTEIGLVKKISGYGVETNVTEGSYLNSGNPVVVRLSTGVASYQAIELTVDLAVGDAGQAACLTAAAAGTESAFVYHIGANTYTFNGFVKSFKFGDASVEANQEATIAIEISSVPVAA